MTHAKRWLFLAHRWLGVLMCALFAMWFVSGVVMMYVGYPKLTAAERLQHLPLLDAQMPLLSPAQALAAAGLVAPLQDLRLAAAVAGRPVYLVVPATEPVKGAVRDAKEMARKRPPIPHTVVLDAQTGAVLKSFGPDLALASAASYATAHGAIDGGAGGAGSAGAAGRIRYLDLVQEDAFTHSRALDVHRPLHRVQLGDADDTQLYISSTTGEVVRDAPAWERWWNYPGAWIHWLYPLRGNLFDAYWTDIVNWLSVLGIAVTLLGSVLGIIRWRFQGRYQRGGKSPYREPMMRWHHLSGLLFALITLTWIFSGLMSMNPWGLFSSPAATLRSATVSGGPFTLSAQDAAPAALLQAGARGVRELRWGRSLGQSVVFASTTHTSAQVLNGRDATVWSAGEQALTAAVQNLIAAPVQRIEILRDYDLYYYQRAPHTMTGGGEKPLPIWRVRFADAPESWVHVDPRTGQVLGRIDRLGRIKRWLFSMLHSWDWLPLLQHRPLWDIALISLSLGGAVLSATSCVIGWRRLRCKLRAKTTPAIRPQ